MEVRQNLLRVPIRAIVFVVLLCVLAMALATFYALAVGGQSQRSVGATQSVTAGQGAGRDVTGPDAYSPRDPIESPRAIDPYAPRYRVGASK